MNRYQRAAEIAQKEVSRVEDLLLLRDAMQEIGDYEQTRAEHESRLAGLKEQEAAATAAIDVARAKASEILRAAEKDAAALRSDASGEKDRASLRAKETVQKAKDEAAKIEAEGKARRQSLADEIVALRSDRDAAKAETEAATKLRDEIKGELESLRARLPK